MGERRKLLLTMLDGVYFDAKVSKTIIAIKPKPAFRPVFQVATTRENAGIQLINEGGAPPVPHRRRPLCFWWRRGRLSFPCEHGK